ncbi:MAG TPA: CHAD domain-containing protein [Solirubrobacteraceae bacterium]|nr:CHAD domain-containing protein [Solirubrobacteraceae bacterium]
MALAQLDLALGLLYEQDARSIEEAVHETRKALKRLRALVRLLREELGSQTFERENAALREIGRSLAGARDAEVLHATLRALVSGRSSELRSGGVRKLQAVLVVERELATERLAGAAGLRAQALDELRAVRGRAVGWPLSGGGFATVEPGLRRVYRNGRRRGRAARRTGTAVALHDWRKRVKDLRYMAELLEALEMPGARQQRMRKAARDAKRIGELLGEEHDLALLSERVDSLRALFAGDRAGRRRLLRQINRQRKRLRAEALEQGERLYRRSPASFTRRLRPRTHDAS